MKTKFAKTLVVSALCVFANGAIADNSHSSTTHMLAPVDAESKALSLLGAALGLTNNDARAAALQSLIQIYPGTVAANAAADALDLAAGSGTASAEPEMKPIEELMAINPDVRACDSLAGHPKHPDRVDQDIEGKGVLFKKLIPAPAILACQTALLTYPDHPRLKFNLARGLLKAKRYEEAIVAGTIAATNGGGMEQHLLGFLYREGVAVEQSHYTAQKWLRRAAEQGFADSQYLLGVMYHKGQGLQKSAKTAVKWYKRAAEQTESAWKGHINAQVALAEAYLKGDGIKKSYTSAFKWFHTAAVAGNKTSQYELALMYERGQAVPRSVTLAVEWYEKAANKGHIHAQNALGMAYHLGRGVKQSDAAALQWFRKASEAGDTLALFNMGMSFQLGQAVPQSYELAQEFFLLAAAKKFGPAYYRLGLLHQFGLGNKISAEAAAKWFTKAAQIGDTRAQIALGVMFEKGDGVEQSDKTAAEWYRKAAEAHQKKSGYAPGGAFAIPRYKTVKIGWYTKASQIVNAPALALQSGHILNMPVGQNLEALTHAAQKGDALAAVYLGVIFDTGSGVAADSTVAAKWLLLALKRGNDPKLTARFFSVKTIKVMQKELKHLGLYSGKIDGVIGPRTIHAIKAHKA